MPKIYCPVDKCEYWVGDGGYTMASLKELKKHVFKDHGDMELRLRRKDGGIVDEMISKALGKCIK